MEPIQVYIPQKKNNLSDLFDKGMTGANVYGLGKGFGWWGKPGSPTPTTAPNPTGQESTAGASGGETFGSVAAPVAVGTAGMAIGAKSQGDYQMKGNRAGNARYAERSGPESENLQTSNWWDSDTVSRRMDLKKQFNPKEITDLLPEVERLPLSRSDKDSIIGKLGEGLRLSKIFKIG